MAVETQYTQQVFGVGGGGEASTLMSPAIFAGKQMFLVGNGVADRRSNLTTNNVSVTNRKRSRAVNQDQSVLPQQSQQFQLPFLYHQQLQLPLVKIGWPEQKLLQDQNRVHDSAFTSTSGRPLIENTLVELVDSTTRNANMEIEALIRLQSESLRQQLEDVQRRRCRLLLAFAEQQAVKRIRPTEIELEKARRRNAELEEQLNLLSNENQLWFNAAKNSEIMVSNLRANLEEAILLKSSSATVATDFDEGSGDNEEILAVACINNEFQQQERQQEQERTRNGLCKVCKGREAGVLLLPCRHLCLCRECEPKLSSCPVCGSGMNAGIQVLFN